jgi:hypothetical protein
MPLIECPECRGSVSDKAASCPHCGHPVAGYGPSDLATGKLTPKKGRGCAGIVILLIIAFVGLVAIANRESEREKANPSCKSDWHLCRDNADLVNNFGDITLAHAYCEVESKRVAKYGTPKFPSFAFSTFYKGDAYVKTGIATLIEKDAQFSNAFGAMVHSTVTCRYDLNKKEVLDESIAPN